MKSVVFSSFAIFGIFLVTEAWATNHPRSCALFKEDCNRSHPADVCDKAYQDAIAHGGVYKAHYFDRRMNQMVDQPINCVP
jgi:hypothetical protein